MVAMAPVPSGNRPVTRSPTAKRLAPGAGFDDDARRLDAHGRIFVRIQPQRDHDVAEVGGHGAVRNPYVARLPAARRRRESAPAAGFRTCPRWPCPVATEVATRRHQQRVAPRDCRARARCRRVPSRITTCGSPTASTAAIVHRQRSTSESTSTIRPGCSVCADRTRPHTAAPARSVTSSPGARPRRASPPPGSRSRARASHDCSAPAPRGSRRTRRPRHRPSHGLRFEHLVRRGARPVSCRRRPATTPPRRAGRHRNPTRRPSAAGRSPAGPPSTRPTAPAARGRRPGRSTSRRPVRGDPRPHRRCARRVQRHPLPGERHQHTVSPSCSASVADDHRVQRGVQQHGVHPESGRRHSGVAGQRHLGEHLVAAAPHRRQPLERRTVPVAARRQPLVGPSTSTVSRPTGGQTDRSAPGSAAPGPDDTLGVQDPARIRRRARERSTRHGRPPRRPRRRRPARPPTGRQDHQRRGQHQLVDDRAAHLVAGPDRQLDETGTGEQHDAADRVVGQPPLRRRRQPARQHHAARGRQLDDRTEQRVFGGRQTEARRRRPRRRRRTARTGAAQRRTSAVRRTSARARRPPVDVRRPTRRPAPAPASALFGSGRSFFSVGAVTGLGLGQCHRDRRRQAAGGTHLEEAGDAGGFEKRTLSANRTASRTCRFQ